MKPTYKILVVEVEQDLGTGRVAIEASGSRPVKWCKSASSC